MFYGTSGSMTGIVCPFYFFSLNSNNVFTSVARPSVFIATVSKQICSRKALCDLIWVA